MKKNILLDKSFLFAVRIVKLAQYLNLSKREYILSKQILRSGTSIGAMIRESQHAESDADFIHKLAIAQKEANETEYWLLLLESTDYLTKLEFDSIELEIKELLKLITAIIKKKKLNMGK